VRVVEVPADTGVHGLFENLHDFPDAAQLANHLAGAAKTYYGKPARAFIAAVGRTGSGKSFFLNFLITNLQKYDPFTFIFDLGGRFRTQLFGGAYLKVSAEWSELTLSHWSQRGKT
jgi:type IV secretory pathway VirB4 component